MVMIKMNQLKLTNLVLAPRLKSISLVMIPGEISPIAEISVLRNHFYFLVEQS